MNFKNWLIALVAVTVVAVAAIGIAAADSGRHHDRGDLAAVAAATTRFHDIGVAKNEGYGELKDTAGIACIDMTGMPSMGAMGIHYVKGALVGDGAVDPLTPEAVIYEPRSHGRLRLVAVEYVVFKADWEANPDNTSPPSLFGQEFNFTPSPNRFGLPPFYSLHAWLFKHNPSGTFSMWNPRVSCAKA
jgi:hypothetical protein